MTAKTQPPSTEVLQLYSEIQKQHEEMNNIWDKDQDKKLISLVELHKEKQWEKVANEFDQKIDQIGCLLRYRKITNVTTKKGAWNSAEDQLLLRCVEKLGNTVWPQVSGLLPGRNPKQCRERWRNQLNPNINRGPFTKEEEELLIKKQAELGTRWSVLSTFFKGRPDNMLKNYWYSLQAQRKKRKNTTKKKRKPQTAPRKRKSSTPKPKLQQKPTAKPKQNNKQNQKTTTQPQEATRTRTRTRTRTTTATTTKTITHNLKTNNRFMFSRDRTKRNYGQTENSKSLPSKVFFASQPQSQSQSQSQLLNSFEKLFMEQNTQNLPNNSNNTKFNQFQEKQFQWTNLNKQDFDNISLENIHNEVSPKNTQNEIALETTNLYSPDSEILIDFSEFEIPRSPTQEIISNHNHNLLQLDLPDLEKDSLCEDDLDLSFMIQASSSPSSPSPSSNTTPNTPLLQTESFPSSFSRNLPFQNTESPPLIDEPDESNLVWKNTIEFDTENSYTDNSYTEIWSDFENLQTESDYSMWELEESNEILNYNSSEFD
ncbi:myb DNA-binding domain superfamily protein-related [Anaeramoeba flamelloides]|uniref:Myb DNA-binding domain superfamily protein-related n=1 Tax=Anaeramoeba flamelloides TaxID=1746091 RepID=A0AAV7ZDC0_9EUKA|nr:myb DNA-binding domain superfamily protein-related [Anaeramoeba flamelloides]